MSDAFIIAQTAQAQPVYLYPSMLNRHGLIAGATGSGKTVTLQKLAESFAKRGIHVFLSDIKGDLSGLAAPGVLGDKLVNTLKQRHIPIPQPLPNSVCFWDVLQKMGLPLRASISDLGPVLLARLMNLNATQTGVLTLLFRIADDENLLLIDLKDLKALVNYTLEHTQQFKAQYGQLPAVSLRTIARQVLQLESLGAHLFFGEPALDMQDLLKTQNQQGVIHILSAEKLIQTPQLYATFLLWLLSSLYDHLPEAGNLPQPKMVFFFDEAHLLFKQAPAVLLEKVEQVVRLIRSKGVGIWFVTQNPVDIPDSIAGQLGNRIQHALRAFTPKDQKALKVAAQTLRANPSFQTETAIAQLKTGEALISCLNEEGEPEPVERAFIYPPASFLGNIDLSLRQKCIQASPFFQKYTAYFDRFSAYEKLQSLRSQEASASPNPRAATISKKTKSSSFLEKLLKNAGVQLTRQLVRGILGTLIR